MEVIVLNGKRGEITVLESIEQLQRSGRVTDAVLAELRELLATGEIKPREKLPTEKELSDAFGVGRSSIREALQVLEHVGLVETIHGVGRFVSEDVSALSDGLNWVYELRVSSAMNLLEARQAVEVSCARLAAERAGPEDVADLSRLLGVIRDASCMSEAFSAEMDFHLRLAESCHNPVMSDLVKMLFNMLRGQLQDFEQTMPFTRDAIVQMFGSILEAIRTRSPDQAERSMKEHFAVTKESFARVGKRYSCW
ncbi:MAG: FadR/GntR family transcriptional regulator [Bacillota bacterium]